LYGRALDELGMALAREGRNGIASLASSAARDFTVTVAHKSIWGLRYKDVAAQDKPVREPQERGYDEYATSPHVEEGALLFEKLLEAMLRIAEYENKLKRLGAEISRTGRRIKTLEELMMPGLKKDIRRIGQYLGERERESFYRLKRAKSILRKREAR
jgi:V/A-type H+-transporting ATPase subunit D